MAVRGPGLYRLPAIADGNVIISSNDDHLPLIELPLGTEGEALLPLGWCDTSPAIVGGLGAGLLTRLLAAATLR